MAVWSANGAMVRVKGEAVVPRSGASTMGVARLTELDGLVMSIRWTTPGEVLWPVPLVGVEVVVVPVVEVPVVVVVGLTGAGELVRKPVWPTKAKPDGAPVPVSNCITGTSEESSRLLPTT